MRTSLYQQFMADPEKNSLRVLAERNYLSMKRVDAILRLKGLEEHWKQVRAHSIPTSLTEIPCRASITIDGQSHFIDSSRHLVKSDFNPI